MTTKAEPQPPGPSGLTIPWGWLSIILGTIAVGALGTLAVVVGTNDVDTLSTIALALAVVAFAAQLIVSLAQGMAGAQQIAQVERVNADTQSALAALRATSDALLSTQRDHFGKLLTAALERAVPEAVNETLGESEGPDDPNLPSDSREVDLQRAILARVEELLPSASGAGSSDRSFTPTPPASPTPQYSKLSTFPSEERGKELLEIFQSLGLWEAAMFARFVERAKVASKAGRHTRILVRKSQSKRQNTVAESLAGKGLITIDRNVPSDYAYRRDLTDLGAEVGSLIVGNGEPPTWLVDARSMGKPAVT